MGRIYRYFTASRSKLISENVLCLILCALPPIYFLVLMTHIRSVLQETYDPPMWRQVFEACLSLFGIINIVGNQILGIIVDISLRSRPKGDDTEAFCDTCKTWQPKDSWHCRRCDICVRKRNHHCLIFARCIGQNNNRYFILFLLYTSISLIYFNVYLYYYLLARCGEDCNSIRDQPFPLNVIYLVNLRGPFILFFVQEIDHKSYFFERLWTINILLFLWAFLMLLYHVRTVLKGVTLREVSKTSWPSRDVLMKNVTLVFGTRWYIAMLWPFAYIPIPERGHILWRQLRSAYMLSNSCYASHLTQRENNLDESLIKSL